MENILTGVSEADKVLYRNESPEDGFLILPDMKWDLTNVSTLYLVALTLRHDIRSLRDLRREHLPLLKGIRQEAARIVKERWGLSSGSLRFYVHYQPSYCTSFEPHAIMIPSISSIQRPLPRTHSQLRLYWSAKHEHWAGTPFGRFSFFGKLAALSLKNFCLKGID